MPFGIGEIERTACSTLPFRSERVYFYFRFPSRVRSLPSWALKVFQGMVQKGCRQCRRKPLSDKGREWRS
jgi:hypothetical protein